MMTDTGPHANGHALGQSGDQGVEPLWLSKVPFEIYSLIVEDLDFQDIYNFLLTCKTMSALMLPCLLQRDIKTETYNALEWACYFGNSSLARQCLSIGASPNATFWTKEFAPNGSYGTKLIQFHREDWNCKGQGPLRRRLVMKTRAHDREDLEVSVRPTKQLYGDHLLQTVFPFSALCLATLRNHLPVMQVLLEYGARQFDHRVRLETDRTPWSVVPGDLPQKNLLHPHQVALSHVRSLAAAQILLNAGGAEFINDSGDSPFTPLEMILSRFQKRRLHKGDLSPQLMTDTPEVELKHLLKLLLKNGASPRRPAHRVLSKGHKAEACDGPLHAAIATGLTWLMEMIIQHGPADPSHPENSEFADIMVLALSGSPYPTCAGPDPRNPFGSQLLSKLEKAGFPILERVGGRFTLPTAIYEAVRREDTTRDGPMYILMRAGVSLDESNPGELCPLSQAIVASIRPPYDAVCTTVIRCISELVKHGANIDNPAFSPSGFTPLFIATADLVHSRVFGVILSLGASWEGVLCQLGPGKPFYTLLQCLLMGLPSCTSDDSIQWPKGLVQPENEAKHRDNMVHDIVEQRQKKFGLLVENYDKLPLQAFYTENGQHILNWAIQNLDGFRLQAAVSVLCPVYYETRRPDDHENPLWMLFSDEKQQRYLTVGTLEYCAEVVKMLVNSIPPEQLEYTNEKGETILHLASQLKIDTPNTQRLDSVRRSCGRDLDFGDCFLKLIRIEPPFTVDSVHPHIQVHEIDYLKCRRQSICSMLSSLLCHPLGISLHTPDSQGKTAYEYARENGTIPSEYLNETSERDGARE